jgi:hypothetical protein
MMGSIKPIPEFVVAPKIVIASPMLGITRERMKLTRINKKVTMAFCFALSF